MLTNITEDVWAATQPLRAFGVLPVVTRMTVIRLPSGGLLLHSPIQISAEMKEELALLGQVRVIVAPNKFHHLFVGDSAAMYPEARVFGAPGLDRKRRDIAFHGMLGDVAPTEFEGVLQPLVVGGGKVLSEVVFLHPPSRTALLADLCFNYSTKTGYAGLYLTAQGANGRFAMGRFIRPILRRRAARPSLEKMLAWDFDRVVMTHGDVLETGGRETLRAALAKLLRD